MKIKVLLASLLTLTSLGGCSLDFLDYFNNESEINETLLLRDSIVSQILSSFNKSYVTENVNLPTSVSGAVISYTSSKPEVFSNDGVVNRQTSDTEVYLTISMFYNGEQLEDYIVRIVVKSISYVPVSEEEDEDTTSGISSVYNLNNGTSVTVTGTIMGTDDSYLYIRDNTGTLTVYLERVYSSLKVGTAVSITGQKSSYNGLTVIVVNRSNNIQTIDSSDNYANPTISKMSQLTSSNQGLVFNFAGLTVVKYTAASSRKSGSLSVSDGVSAFSIKIPRSKATLGKNLFANISTGNTITLNNLVVSYDRNIVIELTNETTLSTQSLVLSNNDYTIENGADISSLFNDLTVNYVGNDGNSTALTAADYTITAPSNFSNTTAGSYVFTLTYLSLTASINVKVKQVSRVSGIDLSAKTLATVCEENDICPGLPQTIDGNINILVLPISFTGCSYDSNYKQILETGFNGTSEETGWESLNSYYYKTSYGKLNIHATVADAYNVGSFSKNGTAGSTDYAYMKNALANAASIYDLSNYDNNNDGVLDCVYFIYLHDYVTSNVPEDSCWWAYTSQACSYTESGYTYSGISTKYDGLSVDYYIFSSYQFFTDPIQEAESYSMFSTSTSQNISIYSNAETIIHETGHALGLDDYYDYNENMGVSGGLGGGAMMDYNVGDHDPYSKAIMGWINPIICYNNDETFELESFEATGDALIIPKSWNGTYFDEYYIIDFYTPTGVNALNKGYHGLFSDYGVAIYHVNAQLDSSNNITAAYDMTLYDNSYTSLLLLSLVESDNDNSIKSGSYSSNSDLWKQGDSASFRWYDSTTAAFSLTVNSISNEKATISIEFK